MTAPPLASKGANGARFYTFPDGTKHPGVTTVLSMMPKGFLAPWYASQAAEFALDHLDAVRDIASRDRKAAVDMIKNAARRNTGAADVGDEIHAYLEARLLRTTLPTLTDAARLFVPAINRFFSEWKPKAVMTERTVRSDSVGYAGSFDAVIELLGEPIIIDWKSGKGVYPETALQLSAYRYADMLDDGDEVPKVTGAAVMHVRPEGVKVHPVKADEDAFEYFRALRKVFQFDQDKRNFMGAALASPNLNKEAAV